MSRSDVELFLEFKEQGIVKALEELIERHSKSLVNFFYHFIWDEALANDLAQDVFIKLAISVKNYTPRAKFTTFLYRIGHNLLIDHLRREQRAPAEEFSLDKKVSQDEDNCFGDLIDSQTQSPLQEIIEQEEKESIFSRIKNIIKTLSLEQRLVVELSVFRHMTYAEISEILDIPVNTVKSRMRWAIIHLSRKKMQG
ncbi:MAG: sigma-70 family RNA polymerase sigma factor [Planctomycetota bacterium]|nr:sigma-70 family RNA polymerase sigma factor [Planctomycetota bacterium]MDI6786756.1 sigma-70 family RNA polymerase sigma factor [Planctomycetota bacterium]